MQHRYHINVFRYPDDDCWIADVPDLKPCSAHGDTPAQALAEAEIAIELWIETAKDRGTSIPEPRYRPSSEAGSHV
jgi:predicted RNase H-like HicB family nuclease